MFDKVKQTFMRFWENIRHWFRRCYGADHLGLCIILVALIFVLLGSLLRVYAFILLAAALYAWAFYRMLSHNVAKRRAEDQRFTQWVQNARREIDQWWIRVRNIRKYKYYRCPNCKARLRMPRGIGEKTVTCSKCGHSFRKKA